MYLSSIYHISSYHQSSIYREKHSFTNAFASWFFPIPSATLLQQIIFRETHVVAIYPSLKKIIKIELSIWSVLNNQGTFITYGPLSTHLVINRLDSYVLPVRHMFILFPNESGFQYYAEQNMYQPDTRQPKHSVVFVFPAIHLTWSFLCIW